ncbi:MAG: helix-turn-helix domain-containing protein [Phycisphaeraceae bacterium]|nr:helix-turn-helix domain-containing protein [Phycisphaeraceae bacterium]
MAEQFGRIPTKNVTAGALKEMSLSDLRVYVAICAFAQGDWTSAIGVSRLIELTGCGRRTVFYALKKLQTLDLLEIESGRGRGGCNRFKLLGKGASLDGTFSTDKRCKNDPEKVQESSVKGATLSGTRSEGSEGFPASRPGALQWPSGEFQRELPTDPTPEEAEALLRDAGLIP